VRNSIELGPVDYIPITQDYWRWPVKRKCLFFYLANGNNFPGVVRFLNKCETKFEFFGLVFWTLMYEINGVYYFTD
jgi:hypothetical protein